MKNPERIALKKEVFNPILGELKNIGILFLIALVIFKAAFYNENILVVLRAVISLFWLFILPGYFATLYWHKNLDFTERIIAGTLSSAAMMGIFSYYLGLLGLNIKFHTILLPLVLILLGFFAFSKSSNQNSSSN